MTNFLTQNWGSILVGAAVLTVITLIILKMISDRKKGKNGCGYGCDSCPSGDVCHKK